MGSPPAVGAMLASSAMLAMVSMKHAHTATVHQMTPAVPPLNRPNQLARIVLAGVSE